MKKFYIFMLVCLCLHTSNSSGVIATGKVSTLAPYVFDNNEVAYITAFSSNVKKNVMYAVGAGYRATLGHNEIFGFYYHIDTFKTTDGKKRMYQHNIGFEYFVDNVEFRFNYYEPTSKVYHIESCTPDVTNNGLTTIRKYTQKNEYFYSGFDSSIGLNIPVNQEFLSSVKFTIKGYFLKGENIITKHSNSNIYSNNGEETYHVPGYYLHESLYEHNNNRNSYNTKTTQNKYGSSLEMKFSFTNWLSASYSIGYDNQEKWQHNFGLLAHVTLFDNTQHKINNRLLEAPVRDNYHSKVRTITIKEENITLRNDGDLPRSQYDYPDWNNDDGGVWYRNNRDREAGRESGVSSGYVFYGNLDYANELGRYDDSPVLSNSAQFRPNGTFVTVTPNTPINDDLYNSLRSCQGADNPPCYRWHNKDIQEQDIEDIATLERMENPLVLNCCGYLVSVTSLERIRTTNSRLVTYSEILARDGHPIFTCPQCRADITQVSRCQLIEEAIANAPPEEDEE